jgi:plasmid stability protein
MIMAQLLVRDLEKETIDRLKKRAKQHDRSLQGEVKLILQNAAKFSMTEASSLARNWQKRLAGKKFSDSSLQMREDRDR